MDLNVSYAVTDRFYMTASIPFVYNERSSPYEYGRNSRHLSYSSGIADLRVGGGYWLFSGEKAVEGNVALGASIKLRTGNFNAQSTLTM